MSSPVINISCTTRVSLPERRICSSPVEKMTGQLIISVFPLPVAASHSSIAFMADIKIFEPTLSTRLRHLEPEQRTAIASRCWPTAESTSLLHNDSAFFDHLQNEVNLVKHHKDRYAVGTIEEVIYLINTMRHNSYNRLSELTHALSSIYPHADEKAVQRSLELCIRLWLTINMNSPSLAIGPTYPLEMPLTWDKNASLNDLIQSRWEARGGPKLNPESQLDDTFTAAYLVNICGMTLHWTEYLSDHLIMDPQRKVLTLFKHKAYLHSRLKSKEENPVPIQVIEEALDTLNLLLPFGDSATKQLLSRSGQLSIYQLGNLGRERKLDLACYNYWKEELETLAGLFSRPPRTWRQLATDRRNLSEWAAFWVTAMIAVLTLVSIPCNLIQATYSVRAYNAAVAQARRHC